MLFLEGFLKRSVRDSGWLLLLGWLAGRLRTLRGQPEVLGEDPGEGLGEGLGRCPGECQKPMYFLRFN